MSLVDNVMNRAGDAISDLTDSVSDAADGISDMADGVSETADTIGDTASDLGDKGSSIFDNDIFELDTLKDVGGSILGGAKDVLTGQETLGGAVGGAVDSLGLPEWAGDFTAAAVDFATKNYAGAVEHGASGLGGVAGAAGADGVADFLDTAGDVTGMFNDFTGPGGVQAAAGSAVGAGGVFSAADQVGDLLGGAGQMAGQADTAMDAITCGSAGDLRGVGANTFDLIGDSFGTVGDVLGDSGGSQIDDAVRDAITQGRIFISDIFDEFNAQSIGDQSASDVLDEVGASPGDCAGMAQEVADIAIELPNCVNADQPLGSAIFGSAAGQAVSDAIQDLAVEQGAEVSIDISIEAVVSESTQAAQGMLDVADFSTDVAREIASTLEQMNSMSASASVSDMRGAEVRC